MSENTSKVTEFYANKNIFITGGTGFLGIALIEKFLRDLPNCGKLYLLMRPKKQKSIEDRLEDMTKNLVFEKLLETESPDIFKKLVPINGDVSEEDLGISPEDRQFLIDNINVVFHSAATLDFQQSLKPTVNINLLGTRRVMELCCEMKKLEACVHVSSAYVNSYLLETEEILYPAPEEAQKVIDLVDSLNEGALKQIEPKLLRDHPNTYTFTKHLAEHEVQKCANRFPCGIIRPSMITAAWKEPVPGWTNSKNGPQGFFMGSSRGVIRRLPLGASLVYDYIPVDTVVNHMIVTGQYINSLKSGSTNPELTIFHCTSGTYKPFRWEMIKDKINEQMHEFPLKSAIWYPHLKFVESLTLFKISAIFVHFLPAYILDFVTKIAGGRPILVKLHTNVWNSLKLLEKFIFTEWKFHNTKALALMKSMTRADQEKFNMDIGELKWDEYFGLMVRGVRRYLSNEDPKTLEAARKKDQILLVLHIVLQALIMFGVWWTSSSLFGLSMAKSGIVVLIFYILFSKFLVKLHTNVWNSLKLLEKFIFTEWKFHNTKALALMKSMTRADQEKFNMDIGELKWDEYFGLMVRGVRRYLSNEDPKTLEAARKKDQILLVLHIVLQALIMFGVWWTSSSLFGLSMAKSGIVVLIFYILFSKL